jgi:hypothetical protein
MRLGSEETVTVAVADCGARPARSATRRLTRARSVASVMLTQPVGRFSQSAGPPLRRSWHSHYSKNEAVLEYPSQQVRELWICTKKTLGGAPAT